MKDSVDITLMINSMHYPSPKMLGGLSKLWIRDWIELSMRIKVISLHEQGVTGTLHWYMWVRSANHRALPSFPVPSFQSSTKFSLSNSALWERRQWACVYKGLIQIPNLPTDKLYELMQVKKWNGLSTLTSKMGITDLPHVKIWALSSVPGLKVKWKC